MTIERVLQDFYAYGVTYAKQSDHETVLSLMAAAMTTFTEYAQAYSVPDENLEEFREYAISAFIDGFGNPE